MGCLARTVPVKMSEKHYDRWYLMQSTTKE